MAACWSEVGAQGSPSGLGPLAHGQLPADEYAVCIVLGNQSVLKIKQMHVCVTHTHTHTHKLINYYW